MGTALGRRHGRNGQIIELTRLIGRTPGALAMKACNFASLDPKFRLTERKGLSGASEAGRVLWQEFSENPEKVVAEAEEAFGRYDPGRGECNRFSAPPS